MIFSIGTALLLLFICLGIPVGFALGIAGIASLAMIVPTDSILALMTKVVHGTTGNYVMLTIPMFVLMAEFLSVGGVAQDLMLASNRLFHKVKGGMAMSCVLAGAVLASASGSSTASAASITRASFPAMNKAGYADSFTLGTIAASGTLAIMIPPSVAFVLYGLMTDTSIGKLFIAGIVPGVLTILGYALTITLLLKFKPGLAPKVGGGIDHEDSAGRGSVWPIGILILLILGALYGGIATPTEISAVGALGALLISLSTRRMNRGGFNSAIGNTLRTSAMILTIIFGAHLFGYFISFTQVTNDLLSFIIANELSPTLVLIFVVLIYLVLGMVMDQAAIIILTAPITTALMVGLGFDAVWWGVVMIKTAEIGMITPPMGLNVFVATSAAKRDLRTGFVGSVPFVVTELVLLALLMAFPQISLMLGQSL